MLELAVLVVSVGVFVVLCAVAYKIWQETAPKEDKKGTGQEAQVVPVEQRTLRFGDDWTRDVPLGRSYLNPGESLDAVEERAEAGFETI